MSYDFRIINKKTKKTVNTGKKHCGILDYGGNIRYDFDNDKPCEKQDFEFNMTYNYSHLLYKYLDKEKGIRFLYGNDFNDSLYRLEIAIRSIKMDYINVLDKDIDGRDPTKKKWNEFFKDNVYDIPKKKPTIKQMEKQNSIVNDYWAVTPNNVIKALQHIVDCMYWIVKNYKFPKYKNFTFEGD